MDDPRGAAVSSETARAFGADNRRRLLDEWFARRGLPSWSNAWEHVYRLLLWIDRTTGLAHCYESDKSQPGRPWYRRSLAFHVWLSAELQTEPVELGGDIDWLFRRAIEDLSAQIRRKLSDRAAAQRETFQDIVLPEPGEDAELEALILAELAPWLPETPPLDALRSLTAKIRAHISVENKRKNLLGEGFEDVLASILDRIPAVNPPSVRTRPLLHELPGFYPPRAGAKPRKVDLGVLLPSGRRTLVSAKWSVRADREEQFEADFESYSRLEARNEGFDYVLVTNEFDPARLVRACDHRVAHTALFTRVVHVNPAGLAAAYGDATSHTMQRVLSLIESGRLASLATWLESVTASTAQGV
jgi:hypothetical protein